VRVDPEPPLADPAGAVVMMLAGGLFGIEDLASRRHADA
jgi:hypothetical protein